MQRNVNGNVFQVMNGCIPYWQELFWFSWHSFYRRFLLYGIPGQRARLQKSLVTALVKNFSAVFACQRSDVNHFICNRDYIFIMLHHQNRISLIPQTAKQLGHSVDITGMHSSTWFVKDICHTSQGAAHMTHQLEALCLAA